MGSGCNSYSRARCLIHELVSHQTGSFPALRNQCNWGWMAHHMWLKSGSSKCSCIYSVRGRITVLFPSQIRGPIGGNKNIPPASPKVSAHNTVSAPWNCEISRRRGNFNDSPIETSRARFQQAEFKLYFIVIFRNWANHETCGGVRITQAPLQYPRMEITPFFS